MSTEEEYQPPYIFVRRRFDGSSELSLQELTLRRPGDEATLVKRVNLTLKPGDRLLISGASGSGKSTIIRAIREAWDSGEGRIDIPAHARIMTSSQKAYMPNTSLKGIVSYPSDETEFYDSQIEQALRSVGHDRLVQHLPERQVLHLVDLTANQIPDIIKDMPHYLSQQAKIEALTSKLAEIMPEIIRSNIDTVHPVSYQTERHIRLRLVEILDGVFGHSTPRSQVEMVATKMSQELKQGLVQKLVNYLVKDIPWLIETNLGKAPFVSQARQEYFADKVTGLITKNFIKALEKAKVGAINQDQADYIALNIKNAINDTLDKSHTWNQTLNKIGYALENTAKGFNWFAQKTQRALPSLAYGSGKLSSAFHTVAAPLLRRDWFESKSDSVFSKLYDRARNNISADTDSLMYGLSFLGLKKSAHRTADFLMSSSALYMAREVVNGDVLMRRLSGGEQQRLAFARALLHHPDILILDEVTAALDKDAGLALYDDIVKKLPDTIIISVAHNMHILNHHTLHGHLQDQTLTIKPVNPAP